MSSLSQRSRWILLILALIAVKGALVLSLSPVFFFGEELEKGTAAKAMLDGLDVPHYQLAYHYYEGGGFVISHCAALAFLVVGQTLLAHKLVALAFQIAILISGCLFMREYFGRKAAQWFGVLWILGPESYQQLSLISLGIHFEACLFLIGVLALGARILFCDSSRPRDWLWLGLVTGVGVYFSYQVVVAAAWVALVLLIFRTRQLFGLLGLCGIAGTVIGALPLIVMYSLVGDAIFDIHGASIAGSKTGPNNLVLFSECLNSIFIEGDLGRRLGPILWTAISVLACVILARSHRRRTHADKPSPTFVAAYLLGYMALFLVAYLSSGFVQGQIWTFFLLLRLVPFWLVAVLLIGAALGVLSDSPRRYERNVAIALGALLAASGVRGTLNLIAAGRPHQLADNWRILNHHKGYTYGQYFAKVLPHFEGTRVEKLQLLETLHEPDMAWLRADAVMMLYGQKFLAECDNKVRVAWPKALQELQSVSAGDAQRFEDYKLGLGTILVIGHSWNLHAAFGGVTGLRVDSRPFAYEALGRFGGLGYDAPENLGLAVERARDVPDSEPYLRGFGRWAYGLRRLDPEDIENLVADFPEDAANQIRAGFEAERAWNLLP